MYTKAVFSKNRKGVCMHVSFLLVNFSRSSQYEAYLQHTWLLSNLYQKRPCNFFTTVRFVKRHFYFSFIQENNKDGNWIKKSFIWSLHLKAWKGLGRINGGLRQGREINEFCTWVFSIILFFLRCLRKIHFRIYCNEPFIHHFWKLIPVPLRISFVFLTFAKLYRKILAVEKARQKTEFSPFYICNSVKKKSNIPLRNAYQSLAELA